MLYEVITDGAQREGSIEELRAMYEAGTIHDDSYVWRDGMGDWQTLGTRRITSYNVCYTKLLRSRPAPRSSVPA